MSPTNCTHGAQAEILSRTHSVCPVCLKTLPANIIRKPGEDGVYLQRSCPEHGIFSGLIWKGEPTFEQWRRPKKPSATIRRETERHLGCPHDCGRCPEHGQHACTVLFEITQACNLRCPVCFADSGKAENDRKFSSLEELTARLAWIHEHAGDIVLQISGGEPTLHPALPSLVKAARDLFPAVQANTNGLLLAEQPELAAELANAGLNWIFLQCDGTTDDVYAILRGRPLHELKMKAIENCRSAGLSVVLVATVAAGVNDHDLGNLLRMAMRLSPTVRGLHLQPMTTSGRNGLKANGNPITLPEVLRAICTQSEGLMSPEHATPPGCEHERCSFHCRYRITDQGGLTPMVDERKCCYGTEAPEDGQAGARRAIDTILRCWQGSETGNSAASSVSDAFSAFIAQTRQRTFSVTCMAFQDAYSIDLERVQGCCVHVYAPPHRLVPFCAYNLTSVAGVALHRPMPENNL